MLPVRARVQSLFGGPSAASGSREGRSQSPKVAVGRPAQHVATAQRLTPTGRPNITSSAGDPRNRAGNKDYPLPAHGPELPLHLHVLPWDRSRRRPRPRARHLMDRPTPADTSYCSLSASAGGTITPALPCSCNRSSIILKSYCQLLQLTGATQTTLNVIRTRLWQSDIIMFRHSRTTTNLMSAEHFQIVSSLMCGCVLFTVRCLILVQLFV